MKIPKYERCIQFVAAWIAAMALLTPGARAWTKPVPETVLYAFHGPDGSAPDQLVQGVDGTLYGATARGGAYGAGTVFALKPPVRSGAPWTFTLLASIPTGVPGQLMIDQNGSFAFYGSIPNGGNSGPYGGYCDRYGQDYGCGSIYSVTPPAGGRGAWTTTTIYEFSGYGDGGEPNQMTASSGSLFGTANSGGNPDCYGQSGCGGVFRLSPPKKGQTAWTESLPLAFLASNSGTPPWCEILGTGVGDVYGAYGYSDGTEYVFSLGLGTFATFGSDAPTGIVADERGVAFVRTSSWTLYELSPPDYRKTAVYRLPKTGVTIMVAHAGAVYGVYSPSGKSAAIAAVLPPGNGRSAWGSRFLYTFSGHSDGANPNALLFGNSGDLYGTAAGGGVANNGVIFRLSMQNAR